MVKFCTSCGTANTPEARFCAKCGSSLDDASEVSSSDHETSYPAAGTTLTQKADDVMPSSEIPKPPQETPKTIRSWKVAAIATLALIIISMLYFWLFLADDFGSSKSQQDPAVADDASEYAATRQLFAVTEVNIRDRPTTKDSSIIGKLPRGSAVTGTLKMGMDGTSGWFELADGKGYIADINLSEIEPPIIAKALNDKIWIADGPLDIWAQADTASALLDRVSEGTKLTLSGLTANDFIEIKLRNGGVGYLAGAAAILARLGGKPIAINFNANSCNFGSEVEALFAQLNAQTEAKRLAVENAKYPNDEAREAAIEKYEIAAEGRSSFLKLQRSFNGLTVTGIAQHYESQSIYFAEPPALVIDTFRSLGIKIGKNGMFPEGDVYSAGIGASGNPAYGKSDLGCGV